MSAANGLGRIRASGVSAEDFASSLGSLLHKPVVDSTGLKGRYDFIMTFTQESIGQASTGSESVAGYTIFEALEKQLGLRLEKGKAAVNVFVIDHMDKAAAEN